MLNDATLFCAPMRWPGQQQTRLEAYRPARIISAVAVTLGLACGATLGVAPITATGAQAFDFGDVWDGVKEVGGAIKDAAGAARDAKKKVESTVRDAAGNAVKEVGGKVYGSIEDKVPSGVKDIGGEVADIGRGAVEAKEAFDREAKRAKDRADDFRKDCTYQVGLHIVGIKGCPFEPKAGKSRPKYQPDRVGPTKSQAVAGSQYKPGEWGGNAGARGKAGAAGAGGAAADRRTSKLRGRVVTKGTDTGKPYPGYPNGRPYQDYPGKRKASKPGKAPSTKAGHARSRGRQAVVRDKRAKTPIVRDKRAKTPIVRDKRGKTPVVRDKRAKTPIVRDKRAKTPIVRDKRAKTPIVRDKRAGRLKQVTPKRLKRRIGPRASRSMDHRARRTMDNRSRRAVKHRSGLRTDRRHNLGAYRRSGHPRR